MSLRNDQLLAPRETIEKYNSAFETTIQNIDPEELFKKVEGLEIQKRILTDAIYAKEPVNIILGH